MNIILLSLCFVFFLVDSERIKIHTSSAAKSFDWQYFPLKTDYLEFNVKTNNNVAIRLSNQHSIDGPYYDIYIGSTNNTRSMIKSNQGQHAEEHVGAIWNGSYQRIWISINDTEESISVGKRPNSPFMYLQDPNYVKMSIFGISSWNGANAYWDFDLDMLKYNHF